MGSGVVVPSLNSGVEWLEPYRSDAVAKRVDCGGVCATR